LTVESASVGGSDPVRKADLLAIAPDDHIAL
jgi:hypothetical protein